MSAGAAHRVVLYGTGGVGKTTLACDAPGPVGFIDLDESLPRLRVKLDAYKLVANVRPVEGVETWTELLDALASDGWQDVKTIVVDSVSRAEELAIAHVIATVKTDGGQTAKSVESYGYGKGYQLVYETFIQLLAALDKHVREGRHVILVCHECTATVPNPNGPDWLRYEPRLQTSATGKASVRFRVKEWADHVLFLGYDVSASADGKGKGGGSATLYPIEMPHMMAKSRTLTTPRVYTDCFANLWADLLV